MSEDKDIEGAIITGKEIDEFMKGYERNPYQLGKLVSAIVRALDKHKTLRLGQLLVAVASRQTGDYDITNFLFNVYDETLIKLLEEF